MKQLKHKFFIDSLHIFVLCSFAISQPLFDLLSQYAEFFVARHSDPTDIILLIFILIIPFPLFIVSLEALVKLISHQTSKVVHGFAIVGLIVLIVMPALKNIECLPGAVVIILGILAGLAFLYGYIYFKPLHTFLTFLAPALLIFPALFLFNSPVFKIIFPQKTKLIAGVKKKDINNSPIIMVIFDEFPATSLMDENRQIDTIRFPNFSALGDGSYWFRNATTVSPSTHISIPVIVTGNFPDNSKSLPTLSDYPNSLFTLLSGIYDMKVMETMTMLCPEKRKKDERQTLMQRMALMLWDVSIIYLHIISPEELSENIPDVRQTWKDFGVNQRNSKKAMQKMYNPEFARMKEFEKFIESIKISEKPTLYLIHTMMPHVPWEYYPSGNKYNAGWEIPGWIKVEEKWIDNKWLVTQAYQRHLLQVGATDMLIGKLINHLERIGLYDRCLIIITADHGVSFLPGQSRRGISKNTFQDILSIPLFIKLPNQHKGIISDRNVETIDILPTIANTIGVSLPWPVDGCSALNASLPERSNKNIYCGGKKLVYESNLNPKNTLTGKISLFGSGKNRPNGLFNIGPHCQLIGQKVGNLKVIEEMSITLEFDQEESFFNINLENGFLPGYITGHIITSETDPGTPINLAVSVNNTIHAVTQTYSLADGKNRFSFLVPEKAFHQGRNNIEVFIVSIGDGNRLALKHPKRKLDVTYSLNSTFIASSNKKNFPLIKGALKGNLKEAKVYEGGLALAGWIFDIKNFQLPETILVFDNAKSIFSGRMNVDRPDVIKVYKDFPLRTGFHFVLPLGLIQDLDNSEVRLFALLKSGEACELYYPKGYVNLKIRRGDYE